MLTRQQGQQVKQDGERCQKSLDAHYAELHKAAVMANKPPKRQRQDFLGRRENEIRAAVRRLEMKKKGWI